MNDENIAWDCDPYSGIPSEPYDEDIDYESDDWQILVLDRFGDRLVNSEY